jgi:ribosomal protein S18 acetylase RimI-like enzyme
MEISPATIEDAEAILALQRLAFHGEAAIYDDFMIPPLTETLEELKGRFQGRRFLKAIEGDQIVGSVRAFQDTAACQVERLIVHPDYRRRGIGTALLRMIETCFPTASCFELFTGHKSESNIRLYERAGYRIVRQERVNDKLSLVFMEKTICVGGERLPTR